MNPGEQCHRRHYVITATYWLMIERLRTLTNDINRADGDDRSGWCLGGRCGGLRLRSDGEWWRRLGCGGFVGGQDGCNCGRRPRQLRLRDWPRWHRLCKRRVAS